MCTIDAYNQGRLKDKDGWYVYYIEVATILYEDIKELFTGGKKEGFVRFQSS